MHGYRYAGLESCLANSISISTGRQFLNTRVYNRINIELYTERDIDRLINCNQILTST